MILGYHKYHVASPSERTVDGILFSSKMEAKRYQQLKLLVIAREIKDLQLQPHFLLLPAFERNGQHFLAINYVADFSYYDCKTKKCVVEEVKGFETEVWKIKKKLFHYRHNMELRIITKV